MTMFSDAMESLREAGQVSGARRGRRAGICA